MVRSVECLEKMEGFLWQDVKEIPSKLVETFFQKMTYDIWLFTHKRMLLETHQCVHVFHSDRWIERMSLEVTMVPSIWRKLPGETERSPDILWVLQGFILGGCLVGFFSEQDGVEPRVWRGDLSEPARTAEGFGVCEGAPAVRQLPSNSIEGWDDWENWENWYFFGVHLPRVKFECSKMPSWETLMKFCSRFHTSPDFVQQ